MVSPEFMAVVEQSAREVLVWVGFGTLVGLAAKALMPGRDPGGALATLMMGIAGCIIGCGVLLFFIEGSRVSPVSPLGFGAFDLNDNGYISEDEFSAGVVLLDIG